KAVITKRCCRTNLPLRYKFAPEKGFQWSALEKRMSANKAKPTFIFLRAPDLNSCFSLIAAHDLSLVVAGTFGGKLWCAKIATSGKLLVKPVAT
ncbi:MAG: hypothetical protein KKF79_06820, partial [Gammaproteobacteria bacterium]|nr:hypothetical protein [Gammaproteobacteria bacterium]